jgi:hypothetical protein
MAKQHQQSEQTNKQAPAAPAPKLVYDATAMEAELAAVREKYLGGVRDRLDDFRSKRAELGARNRVGGAERCRARGTVSAHGTGHAERCRGPRRRHVGFCAGEFRHWQRLCFWGGVSGPAARGRAFPIGPGGAGGCRGRRGRGSDLSALNWAGASAAVLSVVVCRMIAPGARGRAMSGRVCLHFEV